MAHDPSGPLWRRPTWHQFLDDAQRLAAPVPWPARIAAWLPSAGRVEVEQHDVFLPAWRAPRALRLAFASDFHAGPITPPRLIDAAVARLHEAHPDVLLLGGDFVSLAAKDAEALALRLASVRAPLGRFAVLGNHDHHSGGAGVARALEGAGITLLTNRSIRLPAPFESVQVCGIDDHTAGKPDAEAAFDDPCGARRPPAARVLLMHAPSSLLDVGDRRFEVGLCGHTHGGQIVAPGGWAPLAAVGPLSRRYRDGRYALPDGGTLLVSRGVGFTAVPLRINAPSAITICTLGRACAR